ncbi:MAG: V-type ATP synthase subunit C [Anaerolineaceae bacterium]|nr:MAG: V-type ATP synthase subunit C [Anaerolineaceae bacterium]
MTDKQYIYAVARIRSKELTLFTKSDIEQLMSCRTEMECLRYLADKGWGMDGRHTSSEQILASEREKTWELLKELVENVSVFNTFLYGNDYHNLKAAIKQIYKGTETPNLYMSNCTLEPEIIIKAVSEHDFSLLPEHMRDVAEEAYQIQLRTGDSQLCDIVLDKAALDSIYSHGKASENELISQYVELKVAAADINIAIRSVRTKKDEEFLKRALSECESLDINKLTKCALDGMEAIYDYLTTTVYFEGVPALKESSQAFERWCDNLIIDFIRPQKYNPFSLSPLAAYLLARENEIKTVRILLSGKRNDISDDIIRERLREMYV